MLSPDLHTQLHAHACISAHTCALTLMRVNTYTQKGERERETSGHQRRSAISQSQTQITEGLAAETGPQTDICGRDTDKSTLQYCRV